jgi:uncharacterized protein YidB (DUF937 family)
MSLLDQVVGAVTSKLGGQGNAQNDLMEAALSLINNNAGGLSGLVQAFKDKGLANIAASWVSTGKNLPVTPEQIQSVLGNSQIREIAQKLGLSEEAASSQLSQMLPMVVDKLTPEGQIPSGDLLALGLNLLKGKLFG